MKKLFLLGMALALLSCEVAPAFATTSTINPNVPATGSALSSSTLRSNFLAAYNDITNLWASLTNLSASLAPSATIDTTNASNISTGTLNSSLLPSLPTGKMPAFTGDISTSAGSTVTTLATANPNIGSFGSSNTVPVLTLDGKGRVTAASTVSTVGSFNGRSGSVSPTYGDYTVSQVTGAAPLASPTFTGTVTIPSGASISGFAPLAAPTFTGSLNGASATWSGVDTALNFSATGTGANTLPVGTTGQRPSGAEGNIRDNTALGKLEVYIGGGWQQIVSASNGLVNLVSQVSGVLPVSNGGTGASTAIGAGVNTGLKMVPVCNRLGVPAEGGVSSGSAYQINGRIVLYCANGAKTISLAYTGFYISATADAETDLVDPIPLNIGIEVTPGSGNIVPVTCNGNRPCLLPTKTNFAGGSTTQAIMFTDPIAVNVPVGGSIAVNTFAFQTSGQKLAFGFIGQYALGDGNQQYSSSSDWSLSPLSTWQTNFAIATNYNLAPTAAIGIPQTYGPTACILGDSRASGVVGTGVNYLAVGSGGTGYTQADVGLKFQLPGGSSTAVSTPAVGIITQVNNGSGTGAVTKATLYTQGAYGSTQSGQTLPTSPQTPTVSGAHGTGFTVTFTTGNSFDPGDTYGNSGYTARALGATIPYVKFTRSADSLGYWTSRDYSRMALIKAVGCSSVINELGVNDLANLSTMETEYAAIGNQVVAMGAAYFGETLLPETNSTDGYATATNQTTSNANEANRVAFNTWLRTVPSPLTAVFDTTQPVEVNSSNVLTQGGGLWLANGTVGYCSIDGIHTPCPTIPAAAINTALLK